MTSIRIVDYDPRWPSLFKLEERRIRSILGARSLCIEHAGSTAVPGLAAKPVIDIVLVVADSGAESHYVPPLEQAGYRVQVREPDWHQHRMLKGPETDINLHVFSDQCPEIQRMLTFRDWLRNHETDRDLYATAKRALAQQEWNDIQHYADAKITVVEQIMTRAQSCRQTHRPVNFGGRFSWKASVPSFTSSV